MPRGRTVLAGLLLLVAGGAAVAFWGRAASRGLGLAAAARDLANEVAGPYVARVDTTAGPLSVEMVYVPGGRFRMGSPPGEPGREDDDELAPVEVQVGGFWISRHEVTWDLYRAWMDRLDTQRDR